MITVYKADNMVDGNILKALLESHDIASHISGEHLQGALGEVPVLGFVSVWVDDNDVVQAREIIAEWESSETIVFDERFSDDEQYNEEEQAQEKEQMIDSVTEPTKGSMVHEDEATTKSGISMGLVLVIVASIFVIAWMNS